MRRRHLALIGLLLGLLALLICPKLNVPLGDGAQLLALIVIEVLYQVLIDRLIKEEDLNPLVREGLEVRGALDRLEGLADEVVDALLLFTHPLNVLVERREVLSSAALEEEDRLHLIAELIVDD